MSKKLIENLLEYADIAEAGEKSHWALAMREAAKYIKADLDKPEPETYGKVKYIDRIARRAEFNFNTDLNGNIPEWLKVGAKVYARPQVEKPMTEDEFLNLKLPCDIKIGNGKNGKGTTIRTLLLRANNIYESAKLIKRKPLSNDEILTIISNAEMTFERIGPSGVTYRNKLKIARAIESAHGISDPGQSNTGKAIKVTRKAFICKLCEGIYADAPVSECDCASGANQFYEGVISYSKEQE